MSNRLYSIVRRIHSYSGLVLLIFILMYFVTGFVMVRYEEGWMGKVSQRIERQDLPLSPSAPKNPEQLGLHLQREYDLNGKRLPPQTLDDGRLRFRYARPGVAHTATVDPDAATVRIRRDIRGWQAVMVGLHRMHGYGGGWLYSFWALLYDVVCVALIGFALSGVYLWWRLTRGRRAARLTGLTLLAASWGLMFLMMLHLLLSP